MKFTSADSLKHQGCYNEGRKLCIAHGNFIGRVCDAVVSNRLLCQGVVCYFHQTEDFFFYIGTICLTFDVYFVCILYVFCMHFFLHFVCILFAVLMHFCTVHAFLAKRHARLSKMHAFFKNAYETRIKCIQNAYKMHAKCLYNSYEFSNHLYVLHQDQHTILVFSYIDILVLNLFSWIGVADYCK